METWTILILGATGDLARRRLIPTLYELIKHRPDISFIFVGAAIDEASIRELIMSCIPQGEHHLLEKLIARSSYHVVDFTKPPTFALLAQHLKAQEKHHGISQNRLVYLSVDSHWYCTVTTLLTSSGIVEKKDTHRVVYEKPFGWDAQSAKDIDACITEQIEESQIYRIDHYLSKSLVSSLLLTRFSNVFFEPVWNTQFIEQVQIILSEKVGLEGRGDFYDQYGALKDVVQNHILQLLAYIGMEKPPSFDAKTVSDYKSYILRHTEIVDGLLGQYEGYKNVPGVAPDSTRETYALLRAEIATPRWKQVPFYIKTGKALDTKTTEIHIVFKPQPRFLTKQEGFFDANRLIIRISPESAILLRLNTQRGREPAILPITMEFCYRCTFGKEQPHSYERLFNEVMRGDRSTVVSLDEIEFGWDIIKDIQDASLPLYTYVPGSSGPVQAEAFSKRYGISWDSGATSAVPSVEK